MLAISLVHGGPAPGFFSETLFNCLAYGPENTLPILDDVSDFDVAQIIIKVRKIICLLKYELHCSCILI